MDTPEGPWASTRTPSSKPASQRSGRSSRSARSLTSSRTSEVTPLLARQDPSDDEDEETQATATTSLLRSLSNGPSSSAKKPFWKKRWPSVVALVILCIAAVVIMLGFLVTEGIEEYATQAAQFEPTKLSLDSLTDNGVKVQVEGDFTMDASKVEKQSVRNLGRFGTWIAREIESEPAHVNVYLPQKDNTLIGTAKVPGIKVNIRNGQTTHVSFFAHLEPGSFDGIRDIANEWMEGQLKKITIQGKAEVPLRSGIIHLGKQKIDQTMHLDAHDLPALPRYNISKINLREAKNGHQGMGADVSVMVNNEFPFQLTVPPVAVDVLVDGCLPQDQHIMVGTAETARLDIEPNTDVQVNVTGRVEELPETLVNTCPGSARSPLDTLLADYMQGEEASIYVNCCRFPDPETPGWAGELLKDITVKVPIHGRDMGNLIQNFTLADLHFALPSPSAEPGTPESLPRISAVVKVNISLPNEMNFPLNVSGIGANADIYYANETFGKLVLEKYQNASSTTIDPHGKDGALLHVESVIEDAPVEISDWDLFSEIVQALAIRHESVTLDVKAAVSVRIDTPMGTLAVREIPAEGEVPVKPIGDGKDGNNIGSLAPKVGNLSITETSRTSITLQAYANVTNPTNYSATVPYFNINILVNDTVLGQATAKDIYVHPGNNTNLLITAVWDPFTHSGEDGKEIGKELLSQYISGYNTSLTFQTHNGTVPAQPGIGSILSRFPISIPAPHLSTPKEPEDGDDPDDPDKDKDDKKSHFIRDATMHIISSTAIFTLASPFNSTTLYITKLNATAFYEDNPSGKIFYDLPFAVPPGLSQTPRLPVDWSLGSVGYEAIKKALGGTLKLSAFAEVGIRIGQWREEVWYKGGSIGANIRL